MRVKSILDKALQYVPAVSLSCHKLAPCSLNSADGTCWQHVENWAVMEALSSYNGLI